MGVVNRNKKVVEVFLFLWNFYVFFDVWVIYLLMCVLIWEYDVILLRD